MLCLVARFDDQKVRFPLPEKEAILGSAATSDILLPFPGVSRSHARLVRDGNRIHLRDLGSKNRLLVGEAAQPDLGNQTFRLLRG